jgi:glyceraldehyde 3-phosphate dehydrogenase
MAVKVAINGFGRIGRNVLRAIIESGRTDIEVIAINDLGPVETNAHLLRHDSVHGKFPVEVRTGPDSIDVGRGPMQVTALKNPADLPWGGVDIVLECTGIFTSKEKCLPHLENGSKRVLISAPGEGADKTIVYGVNHNTLTANDIVVSNASCTTNALAPLARLLDAGWGIVTGSMTTVHCYTGSQPTVDAPAADPARSRAAALSMVPTTTSAARLLDGVLPHLSGRIVAQAVRVPVASVSCVDFHLLTERRPSVDEVNAAFRAAGGVIGATDRPLVSTDLRARAESVVMACPETKLSAGGMLRVFGWYDNEWGFSNRMLDMALRMA